MEWNKRTDSWILELGAIFETRVDEASIMTANISEEHFTFLLFLIEFISELTDDSFS